MHQTKRKLLTATLAAFTLASALPAFAQGRGPRGGQGNRLNFLAGYLSLTDAQKTQAQAIFDAAETASTTAQGQLTAAHEALQVAVKANAADGELDRLAAVVGTIQGQLTGIRAKASAKFYALLTAEQKTKYDAIGDRQKGAGPTGRRGNQ